MEKQDLTAKTYKKETETDGSESVYAVKCFNRSRFMGFSLDITLIAGLDVHVGGKVCVSVAANLTLEMPAKMDYNVTFGIQTGLVSQHFYLNFNKVCFVEQEAVLNGLESVANNIVAGGQKMINYGNALNQTVTSQQVTGLRHQVAAQETRLTQHVEDIAGTLNEAITNTTEALDDLNETVGNNMAIQGQLTQVLETGQDHFVNQVRTAANNMTIAQVQLLNAPVWLKQ